MIFASTYKVQKFKELHLPKNFFISFVFSYHIILLKLDSRQKAPVITIKVVQNSKEQPDSSKTAIPKREEIEDISFLRSGKGLKISFGLKQTNI